MAARLPPVPSTLTPRQQERRDRLVDAGLALLDTRHYEDIQVKDVADAADVALGTLYHYFSSKEHLFAEVLIKWAATLRTNLNRHPLAGCTTTERLTETFHRAVRGFQKQPQLARLVATLEMSSDPFATEIFGRLDQATTSVYLEALAASPAIPVPQAEGIVRVMNSVFSVCLREWSFGRMPIVQFYDRISETARLLLDFSIDRISF
jgi:AcrR family transcriptional regulator